jgi:hypothetical protein
MNGVAAVRLASKSLLRVSEALLSVENIDKVEGGVSSSSTPSEPVSVAGFISFSFLYSLDGLVNHGKKSQKKSCTFQPEAHQSDECRLLRARRGSEEDESIPPIQIYLSQTS